MDLNSYGCLQVAFRQELENFISCFDYEARGKSIEELTDHYSHHMDQSSLSINSMPVSNGVQSPPIVLNEQGSRTDIEIVRTASDGLTKQRYTVTVVKELDTRSRAQMLDGFERLLNNPLLLARTAGYTSFQKNKVIPQKLLDVAVERRAIAGKTIVHTGDKSEEVYILQHGALEVLVDRELKGTITEPGRMFGESCFDEEAPRRTADIRATVPTTFLALRADQLDRVLSTEDKDGRTSFRALVAAKTSARKLTSMKEAPASKAGFSLDLLRSVVDQAVSTTKSPFSVDGTDLTDIRLSVGQLNFQPDQLRYRVGVPVNTEQIRMSVVLSSGTRRKIALTVPVVLLCYGGGPVTLRSLAAAASTPQIIVKGSGRVSISISVVLSVNNILILPRCVCN